MSIEKWLRTVTLTVLLISINSFTYSAFSSPKISYLYANLMSEELGKVRVGITASIINDSENKIAEEYGRPSTNFTTLVGDSVFDVVTSAARFMAPSPNQGGKNNVLITTALDKMRKDMEFLDDLAGRTPQLTRLELAVLLATVGISALSPAVLSIKVVELLVPSMAALSAAVGISAEYVGKVSVSNGKEIAALAIQATAESEILLAQAERVKAILPLCVGVATTASAFALLAPSIAAEMARYFNLAILNEFFLFFPLIAVLSAAVAGLATEESSTLVNRAIGLGNRRFASSNSVGRTWLSATEQVEVAAEATSKKWNSFALGVLPSPIFAALFPGPMASKAIACAAFAAAQAAYYLAVAEYSIAAGTKAIALKARSAAVADTYANQGARSGAILPFTSALAGLCAAASAASVELLPLITSIELQSLVAVLFPTGAALFAAAATVSKARCEVDAAAAAEVASQGLAGESSRPRDPVLVVRQLINLTVTTTISRFSKNYSAIRELLQKGQVWGSLFSWMKKIFRGPSSRNNSDSSSSAGVGSPKATLQLA